MKRVLIVTPYYPYPAEKNGGIHTLHELIKNLPNRVVDIFYYGEEQNEEVIFSPNIKNVYYENLVKDGRLNHLLSILKRTSYSLYQYKNNSKVLTELSKIDYDEIYIDQYSSFKFASIFYKKARLICIAHDSMPMYFERKKKFSNNMIGKIYYNFQMKFSKKEEKEYYKFFSKIAYVSGIDVEYEKKHLPEYSDKFFESNVGIDIDKVNNSKTIKLPGKTIIFTGVMRYEPNHDAMMYFVNNIWDKLYELDREVNLYIVGKDPQTELVELCKKKQNITVTGMVDNVFSYIKSSTLYISPLRFGSGKKNKILEALACGVPLIASNISMEGFKDINDCVLIANTDQEWISQIHSLLNDEQKRTIIKSKMSNVINKEYNWKEIARRLVD